MPLSTSRELNCSGHVAKGSPVNFDHYHYKVSLSSSVSLPLESIPLDSGRSRMSIGSGVPSFAAFVRFKPRVRVRD